MQSNQPRSFYRVYPKPAGDDLHLQLGHAMAILCASRRAMGRQVRFVEHVVIPAIMHRQLVLLFDEDGEPAAYVMWASLTEQVEQRVAGSGRLGLHFSEWDEGERTWIVDIAARPGCLKYVIQYCRDVLFRDVEEARYMRLWSKDKRVRHIRRDSLAGCLRSMPPAASECRCGRMACLLDAPEVPGANPACPGQGGGEDMAR